MSKKVGVCKEEMSLPYYKYYARDLAPIPQEKLDVLQQGPSSVPAIPFAEKDRFLKGEDGDYCQLGYGIQPDGTGFVCNTTYMPGVTGEMLDWWFPWHSVGADLRYKLWDPEDHYFARADNVPYVVDPKVPIHQKTWGVNHQILEDLGQGKGMLTLCFKSPKDFGYDPALVGGEKCQSLVCAIGAGLNSAAMTHKWYPYQDGVMFCSRFWMGFRMENGQIVKALPEGASIPEAAPKGLFAHNIKEFTNLASILPEIYAEMEGKIE
jgi:hypothetical protein